MTRFVFCILVIISLHSSIFALEQEPPRSKSTPGTSLVLQTSLPLTSDSKVNLKWTATGYPSGSRIAVYAGSVNSYSIGNRILYNSSGNYILYDIDPKLKQVELQVPSSVMCGDVGSEVKEIFIILYQDPDKTLNRWCTFYLPYGAPSAKNIKIYAYEAIPVKRKISE